MPSFVLKIKADLENIKCVKPKENNDWMFNIQSPSGEVRERITFCKDEELEIDGSRGTANFIIRFTGSSQQSYIKIIDIKKCDGLYQGADSGNYVTILGLECRGLEPIAWVPSTDFVAESFGGTMFPNVDLSDRDWADYDDENDLSVSIMNLEYIIEKI